MAMSIDIEAYLEKLECPICQDIMQDCCDTSCGHSFCEYCIDSCLEARPNVCPVCKKDPSPVHPSFTLRTICDSVRALREGTEPPAHQEEDTETSDQEKQHGNEKYGNGKFAEAIQHYTKALSKSRTGDMRNAVLYNNRAQCYIKIDQHKRALDDCEEAIKLDNKDVKAFMRKGLCLYKLGNFPKSREAYFEARRLDKDGKWKGAIDEALASLPDMSRPAAAAPGTQPPPFYAPQAAPQYTPYPYQPPPPVAPGARPSGYPGQYPGQYNYQFQQQQQPYPPFGGAPAPAPAPAAAAASSSSSSSSSSSTSNDRRRRTEKNNECSIQ